jgi:hypothetical protein
MHACQSVPYESYANKLISYWGGQSVMDEIRHRGWLAEILISISLIGLIAISAAVIRSSEKQGIILVFTSLLPLFGTWIGLALAYYFSLSNFAMVVNAFRRFTAPSTICADIAVTTAMIEKSKIAGLITLAATEDAAARINIKDHLLALLHPPVTRIPILDSKGAIVFIVHENTLHKFMTDIAMHPRADVALPTATLQHLLEDRPLKALLETFDIVPSSATLADAKKKMDKTPHCKDVFVTPRGRRSEAIIGWVTDARVAKFGKI